MQERCISLSWTQIGAYALAVIGVVLIVLNFWHSSTHDHLGFAAIPFIALSMILAIRSYFCRMSVLVRETRGLLQDAYDMGREVAREESSVRPLR